MSAAADAMETVLRRYRVVTGDLLVDLACVSRDAARRRIRDWARRGNINRLDTAPLAWVLVRAPVSGGRITRFGRPCASCVPSARVNWPQIHDAPPEPTIKTYVKRLVASGILISDRRRPARYRLVSGGYNGPAAPAITERSSRIGGMP